MGKSFVSERRGGQSGRHSRSGAKARKMATTGGDKRSEKKQCRMREKRQYRGEKRSSTEERNEVEKRSSADEVPHP